MAAHRRTGGHFSCKCNYSHTLRAGLKSLKHGRKHENSPTSSGGINPNRMKTKQNEARLLIKEILHIIYQILCSGSMKTLIL